MLLLIRRERGGVFAYPTTTPLVVCTLLGGRHTLLNISTIHRCTHQVFCFFSFVPFNILALLSLAFPPSLVVTQIRSHMADPPPPSALRYVPSNLSRDAIILQHFLASSTRVDLCIPTLLGALFYGTSSTTFFMLFANINIFKSSPRWESKTQGPMLLILEGNY